MKFIKALFFVLATAVMALCLLFSPEASGSVSISYTAVLGIYLGLDIASMIAKTTTLKKGDYETLNVYKYVLSAVCLVVLIVVAIIVKGKYDVTTAMTSFLTSSMIIIGCIIGGLEGNKIATGVDGGGTENIKEIKENQE